MIFLNKDWHLVLRFNRKLVKEWEMKSNYKILNVSKNKNYIYSNAYYLPYKSLNLYY